jgi:hypothetical protein
MHLTQVAFAHHSLRNPARLQRGDPIDQPGPRHVGMGEPIEAMTIADDL